ncbi:putative mRNA-decapping enzyme subunit 1, PH-like domain superfamily [Helianthus anomalus]
MDPYIKEILITAAHITFYEFNVDLNKWQDCNNLQTDFNNKPQDKAEPLDVHPD